MKVYKVTLRVLDFDGLGEAWIKEIIEHQRYPNHCINPRVHDIEGVDIGEWGDSHPLNNTSTAAEEFERLFASGNDEGEAL